MPSPPLGAHSIRLTVRYGETDQMGFAHHANYLLYFEEARTSLMATLGLPYSEVEAEGIGLPVRKANLRYRKPARFEDELQVSVWVEKVGPASVIFGYHTEHAHGGTTVATGMIELASIVLAEGSLCPLPEHLKAALVRGMPSALREGGASPPS